jgi:hypothetical protein
MTSITVYEKYRQTVTDTLHACFDTLQYYSTCLFFSIANFIAKVAPPCFHKPRGCIEYNR